MRRARRMPICGEWHAVLLIAALSVAGCDGPMEPPDSAGPPNQSTPLPPALQFGSVTGSGRPSPIPWDGAPLLPLLRVSAQAPGRAPRAIGADNQTGAFRFDLLTAETWTLNFRWEHPFGGVFPGMRLFADTAIAVTVLPNQAIAVSEVVPRSIPPFVLVATEICPFSFSSPPTLTDWGACDSGYWGGLDVAFELHGVAGTATAGVSRSFSIPQDSWFTRIDGLPPGEYDVSAVPSPRAIGASFCNGGTWRIVPWRSLTVHIGAETGVAYAEFEFWCQI